MNYFCERKEVLERRRIWKDGGFGRIRDLEGWKIWKEGRFERKKEGFGKKT